jgi:hypothetical protein
MIPFANETVTLIHRSETTDENGRKRAVYTKHSFGACSWRRISRIANIDNALTMTEYATVRIPVESVTAVTPTTGDLMIRGEYAGSVSSSADFQSVIEAMRGNGGAFVVGSVSDNTRSGSPLPHFKVTEAI